MKSFSRFFCLVTTLSSSLVWGTGVIYRSPIYFSPTVHGYMTAKQGRDLTLLVPDYKASDFIDLNHWDYQCPGDSFVVGMESRFDDGSGRRSFRFACAFLDIDGGEAVSKGTCHTTGPINAALQSGGSECAPGELLTGLKGDFDPQLRDYSFSLECCAVSSKTVKTLASKDCTEITLNAAGFGAFLFFPISQINSNRVYQGLKTSVLSNQGGKNTDRTYIATSCLIE